MVRGASMTWFLIFYSCTVLPCSYPDITAEDRTYQTLQGCARALPGAVTHFRRLNPTRTIERAACVSEPVWRELKGRYE